MDLALFFLLSTVLDIEGLLVLMNFRIAFFSSVKTLELWCRVCCVYSLILITQTFIYQSCQSVNKGGVSIFQYIFLNLCVWCLLRCVCALCVCLMPEEGGIGLHGTTVTDSCEDQADAADLTRSFEGAALLITDHLYSRSLFSLMTQRYVYFLKAIVYG